MELPEDLQMLVPAAEDTGVALLQRFTETEAAEFLHIQVESLTLLRHQGRIAFIRIDHEVVRYMGYQLLQYLMSRSIPAQSAKQASPLNERIVRAKEVIKITGLSRTTIWRMEKVGTFPARVSLGGNSVGWKHSEVQQWLNSRETL